MLFGVWVLIGGLWSLEGGIGQGKVVVEVPGLLYNDLLMNGQGEAGWSRPREPGLGVMGCFSLFFRHWIILVCIIRRTGGKQGVKATGNFYLMKSESL